MNNRKLGLAFIILLGVWAITSYIPKDDTGSFETDLIRIDTTQVNIIKIELNGEIDSEITLQRNTTSQWLATKGTVTTIANKEAINSVLNSIQRIQTKRIAAKKKEKWPDYKVDESNGTSIKIYTGSQLLEDFIVGRFSFNQQTNQGLSYVRINGGEEVYEIDGFLSKNLGQRFYAYRNKDLIKIVKEDITSMSLTKEEGTVQVFNKLNNEWTNNDSLVLDSIHLTNYLSGIQNLIGQKFVDDIDPTTYRMPKYRTLVITGNNMPQPVTITCYRDEAKNPPYIIQSSQNIAAYFSSEEGGLFQKIFGILETPLAMK